MQRMIDCLLFQCCWSGSLAVAICSIPEQATTRRKRKCASGVETMINLTTMMEATASKAKGGKGVDTAFDDLHNQFPCAP